MLVGRGSTGDYGVWKWTDKVLEAITHDFIKEAKKKKGKPTERNGNRESKRQGEEKISGTSQGVFNKRHASWAENNEGRITDIYDS